MQSAEQIALLIAQDNLYKFYTDRAWRKLRRTVLEMDKHECQACKARGRYKRATHVHHVNHVRVHPELAMSIVYKADDGVIRRNLISLCNDCHEKEHDYRQKVKHEPLTEERW